MAADGSARDCRRPDKDRQEHFEKLLWLIPLNQVNLYVRKWLLYWRMVVGGLLAIYRNLFCAAP